MSRGRKGGLAVAPVVALLLVGCAGRGAPGKTAEATAASPGAAIERLARQGARASLYDGELRLSGRHRGARVRARAVAVVEPEGRFYLETVEGPSTVVASDGEEIRVILAADRQWLRTPSTVAAMEALFGLPILPDELGALLGGTGAPPRLLAVARSDGSRGLEFPGGRLELDPTLARVVSGENRGLVFRQPHANRLSIIVPSRRLTLEVQLQAAPGAGVARPMALFRPVPPAAFREVLLADLAVPVLLPAGDGG